jgi:hypothetical protein
LPAPIALIPLLVMLARVVLTVLLFSAVALFAQRYRFSARLASAEQA